MPELQRHKNAAWLVMKQMLNVRQGGRNSQTGDAGENMHGDARKKQV